MSEYLTNTKIPGLPPGNYKDAGAMGLQLRVTARKGGKLTRAWHLRFKFRGEESRILLGHFRESASQKGHLTLEQARRAAGELREKADAGIDPRRARPRRLERLSPSSTSAAVADTHTIEFLCSEFLERHVNPSRKRPEYAKRILDQDVLTAWKGRDARTIKPREVIELLDGIVDRGSTVMANRVAGLLGQLFRFGIHRTIVDDSPVKLLYRPGGREKARERTLSDNELRAFLANPRACSRFERLELVIKLLLLTGQRRGELALARWRDVNLKAGTWTIPDENAKAGRGHVVPLTPWAVDLFKTLRTMAEGSTCVLPAREGSRTSLDPKQLTRSLAKCRTRFAKYGVAAFTLHDLRRTCRTGLARLGVAPHIAERVLNHAQDKIPGTYDTHDYLAEKRAALEKWEQHLRSLEP